MNVEAATRGAAGSHVGRAAGAVVRAQLRLVREEARQDSHRVLSGVAFLIAGALLLTFTLAALDVALGLYVAAFWGGLAAAFVVAGADFAVAVIVLLVARWRLSQPMMARTRSLARETAMELRRL